MLAVGVGCGGQSPSPVVVFAAASTRLPMEEVLAQWSEARGVDVRSSFASSSTLARQIDAGARAHVFLSADRVWMDWLETHGVARRGEAVVLLRNELVVIGAPGRPVPSGLSEGRLAVEHCLSMGDPSHVPAGRYGKEALEALGTWEVVSHKVAPALDAPSAVRVVESGNCDVGLAYRTDTQGSRVEVGPALATPSAIHYPLVALDSEDERSEASIDDLMVWLQGPSARAVFARYGFGQP